MGNGHMNILSSPTQASLNLISNPKHLQDRQVVVNGLLLYTASHCKQGKEFLRVFTLFLEQMSRTPLRYPSLGMTTPFSP